MQLKNQKLGITLEQRAPVRMCWALLCIAAHKECLSVRAMPKPEACNMEQTCTLKAWE